MCVRPRVRGRRRIFFRFDRFNVKHLWESFRFEIHDGADGVRNRRGKSCTCLRLIPTPVRLQPRPVFFCYRIQKQHTNYCNNGIKCTAFFFFFFCPIQCAQKCRGHRGFFYGNMLISLTRTTAGMTRETIFVGMCAAGGETVFQYGPRMHASGMPL